MGRLYIQIHLKSSPHLHPAIPCVFGLSATSSNIPKGLGGTLGVAPLVGHALLRRDFRLACEILVCEHEVRGKMEVLFLGCVGNVMLGDICICIIYIYICRSGQKIGVSYVLCQILFVKNAHFVVKASFLGNLWRPNRRGHPKWWFSTGIPPKWPDHSG